MKRSTVSVVVPPPPYKINRKRRRTEDDGDVHTRPKTQRTGTYQVGDGELVEDQNLQITGETDPREFSEDSDDGRAADDMPLRLLNDFVIYDLVTHNLVHVGALLQLNFASHPTEYGASGVVEAWVDDEDDAEAEEDESSFAGQRVKLSRILEINVHHISQRTQNLDGKIYVRTQFAWYILDEPSPSYQHYFSQFWIQHRIFHLVVSRSLVEPNLTYDEFIDSLKVTPDTPDSIAISLKILGRELTVADVESEEVKSYFLVTLDDLLEQSGIVINHVPLVHALRGCEIDAPMDPILYRISRKGKQPTKRLAHAPLANKEKDVLQHRNQTVVTPRVGKISQRLFEQTLKVAGRFSPEEYLDDARLAQAIDEAKAHHLNPLYTKWSNPTGHKGFYSAVIMDDVVYNVGDVVMVCPGTDENQVRAKNAMTDPAQTRNALGNRLWFCKIWYFFEREREKYFHAQWLVHGSKTLLQETAHPQSLFLMNSCDDIPLASIFQKCKIRWLSPEEDEPPEDNQGVENDFFCSLVWNEGESSFIDLPTEKETDLAITSCDDKKPCYVCGSVAQEEVLTLLRPLPGGGFTQFNEKYHVGDFIYVKANRKDGRHDIAQITKMDTIESPAHITVTFLERYDDFMHQTGTRPTEYDERRLYLTDRSAGITSREVDGQCFIRHLTNTDKINDWVAHDDHYYLNQVITPNTTLAPLEKSNFKKCDACYRERINALRHNGQLRRRHQALRGLELFSGAGGLSTGFDMSEFVETRAAVEFSPSAAKTFGLNHPTAKVYNQCANLLLKHAIDCFEGKKPPPLFSLHDGRTALPPMPKPGEIDFVFGGPPCQSFSGANRWKKANDVRSTLICNMLSYVEFYQPSHFLLENVIGLLQYQLNGRQAERSVVDGIQMGVVKFIERSLITLGYQVRVKVLQAGQYGAPQSRKRVIFWGGKRGIPLPEFPKPTHAFQPSFFYKLPTGDTLQPATRSKDPKLPHQLAPLNAVTVNDAIGDLPAFEWTSPHLVIPSTRQDVNEARRRETELGIPSFDADRRLYPQIALGYPGYPDPVPYLHPPQTRYQKRMRSEAGDKVTYHYTRRFNEKIIERAWNVPLRGNADHADLPLPLQPRRVDGQLVPKDQVLYGRIDGDGYFQTAMTTVGPSAKGSRLLHPTQKRILTVRECARAQGFPDHYQFVSLNRQLSQIVEDQHRQIGNAVPIPLALALGKALGESLLEMWDNEDREGSVEV